MEQFLADGILDPCSNSSTTPQLVDLEIDQLCAAMVENDLSAILEQEPFPFPIEFCHSPQDEVNVITNLPTTLHDTEMFTLIKGIKGDHYAAGETCFLHVVSSAIKASTTSLVTYSQSMPALHDPQACHETSSSGGGNSPFTAPNSNGDTSASSTSSIRFLDPITVFVYLPFFLATVGALRL